MKISSRNVVEGTARAPHRAMYKAKGLTNEDLAKSMVGVCHTGNEATPCLSLIHISEPTRPY